MTSDGTHTYQYDGEGRLKSIDNGATATSTFNALGLRVYRTTSGGSVSYWHDIFNQGIGGAWTGGSNAFIPFGNRLLADYEGDGAHFAHANSLGSTTQTTNWAGGGVQEVTFYPWGRIWNQTTGYFVHQLFASLQDYDPDMDQYQTPNRMYPPILGRWFTPDPAGMAAANPANPQSWNRYAYALNNPANLTDPLGLQQCHHMGDLRNDGSECGTRYHPGYFGNYGMSDALYGAFGSLNTREFDFIFYLYGTKYNEGDGEENLWGLAPFGFLFSGVLRSPQSQPPTWLLQTKVFISTLGQNFVDEFKGGGCVNAFLEGMDQADVLDPVLNGSPNFAETTAKATAGGMAVSYAAKRLLTVPMRSSVVRGTLGMGETLAGAFGPLYLDAQALGGLAKETLSMYKGTCH